MCITSKVWWHIYYILFLISYSFSSGFISVLDITGIICNDFGSTRKSQCIDWLFKEIKSQKHNIKANIKLSWKVFHKMEKTHSVCRVVKILKNLKYKGRCECQPAGSRAVYGSVTTQVAGRWSKCKLSCTLLHITYLLFLEIMVLTLSIKSQ